MDTDNASKYNENNSNNNNNHDHDHDHNHFENRTIEFEKNDPILEDDLFPLELVHEEEVPDHSDFIDLSFRDDENNTSNSILFCALVFAKEFAKDEYERRNNV